MKHYDSWEVYNGFAEGSGRSEKIWLISSEGKIGLFKFPKSDETTEHVSERLAYSLSRKLGIECATVEIGKRDSRIGSCSLLINQQDEELVEGINYINKLWPFFNSETMFDAKEEKYYSLKHILDSTRDYVPTNSWVEMLFFDYLIGNTDRHQSNWAILTKSDGSVVQRAPLYDNGSSLCCYVKSEDIIKILGTDKNRFRALTDTKSKSRIRIDEKRKTLPTHREVVKYLFESFPRISNPIARSIIDRLAVNDIDEVLEDVKLYIEDDRRELIKRFLLQKIQLLKEMLNCQ